MRDWLRRFRRPSDEEFAAELEAHLAHDTDEQAERGLPPEEARYAALRRFGNLTRHLERFREASPWFWLETLWQDVRYGWRSLWRNPAWLIAAAVTLAFGVGLAVAMFTVFDAVLRQPLPVSDQERVVVLWGGAEGSIRKLPLTHRHFQRFRQEIQTLSDVAGTISAQAWPHAARERDNTFLLGLAAVTGNFFDVLGSRPPIGRTLRGEDDVAGAPPVMVISERLWRTRFGADRRVIGRRITLHERKLTYTVVGVAPPGLEYPAGTDGWVAVTPLFTEFEIVPLGRLKPGVTPSLAAAELQASFSREPSASSRELGGAATPLADLLVGDVRPALVVLSSAAALLLLIACLNVSNLLLVRASTRTHEVAVRRALGAGRHRIVRQLLTESSMLAVAGGLLGAVVADALLRALLALAPSELPRLDAVRIGGVPLGMAATVTGVTVLIFGVFPAIWASGHEFSAIRAGGPSSTQPRAGRTAQHALAVLQVALAIVVLTAAGLLGRTLRELQHIDMGFTAEHVTMLQLAWPREKFDSAEKVGALYERLVPRLEALPEVVSAAPVNVAPFTGALAGWDGWVVPEGRPDLEQAPPVFNMAVVGAGYFRTLDVPLLRGRTFGEADREGSPRTAVVSEALARLLWPDQDALNKRFSLGQARTPEDWWTVIGIVPETKYRALRQPTPTVYLPYRQFGGAVTMITTVAVRTDRDPSAALAPLRHALREVDPDVLVMNAEPLKRLVARQLAQPRLNAWLLGVFSLGALLLASIGLYAVLAYVVRRRMPELAIRHALGASPSRLRWVVVHQALAIAGAGMVLGVAAALAGARLLDSVLYGVSAADPLTLAGVVGVLLCVAVAAAYIPGRRAARVDPTTLLREG